MGGGKICPLPFSKKTKFVLPSRDMDELADSVKRANSFVVYLSLDYYRCLKIRSKNIQAQLKLARNLNKPVILLIDASFTEQMIIEVERYFTRMNIIKEIIFDFNDKAAKAKATEEVELITRQYFLKNKKVEVTELLAGIFRWY